MAGELDAFMRKAQLTERQVVTLAEIAGLLVSETMAPWDIEGADRKLALRVHKVLSEGA